MQPVTRYAKSGDIHVAYQVFGEGPLNLVFAPLFVSNIDLVGPPRMLAGCFGLGSYARVGCSTSAGPACRIGLANFRLGSAHG